MFLVHEKRFFGIDVFFMSERPINGVVEIPTDFVAVHGQRALIVGAPHHDVKQAAFAYAGFERLYLETHPRGGRTLGLLVDLVA